MKQTSLLLSLALFAGMILLGTVWCDAQQQPAGAHLLAIGVVRMSDITRASTEYKQFQLDRRTKLADLQQQQQRREMELQEMQKHRDLNTKEGSQQWINETQDMDTKLAELDTWEKTSQIRMERWEKKQIKEYYDHIAAAAAAVAQKNQLDLVVADQSPDIGPDLDKVPTEKLLGLLGERTVLFANKKADITQDVLAEAEANFANHGGAKAGPPGPAPGPAAH